jgi:hypothetical protein
MSAASRCREEGSDRTLDSIGHGTVNPRAEQRGGKAGAGPVRFLFLIRVMMGSQGDLRHPVTRRGLGVLLS